MNFVLVNPQYINVSNPVTKETIRFKQEEINMATFFTEESCDLLLAKCKTKRTYAAIYIEFVWSTCLEESYDL